jgi:hypothetical protein
MKTDRIVVFSDVAGGMGTKDRARGVQIELVVQTFRKMFSGPISVNTAFVKARANAVLASDDANRVDSACLISPIRIWRRDCAAALRSTSPIRPLSMARDSKATPTILRGRW